MNIAVYCSARTNLAGECTADAARIGAWIGGNGHRLVYGGLAMGLMDVVATAVAAAGGKVNGIVPESRARLTHPVNTVSIPVATLHERKALMEQQADAFVALDGGYGTLDEVMSALASMSFFNEPKPLLLLNRRGLYTPLKEMFAEMEARGLMNPGVAGRMELLPDAEALLARLDEISFSSQVRQ